MECNAMVINHPGGIDSAFEVFIPIALIELEPQCFHINYDSMMGSYWVPKMPKERLSVRISKSRLEKLRRIAEQKEKTMTQLIEDWIDKLKEEKPS
jgi:hypothetical protein